MYNIVNYHHGMTVKLKFSSLRVTFVYFLNLFISQLNLISGIKQRKSSEIIHPFS